MSSILLRGWHPEWRWADNTQSSGLSCAFQLNTTKRRFFDCTVKSMIISHDGINTEVYTVCEWNMSRNKKKKETTYLAKLALPTCTHPDVHSVYTNSRVKSISKQIAGYQYSSERRAEFVMIKDCRTVCDYTSETTQSNKPLWPGT